MKERVFGYWFAWSPDLMFTGNGLPTYSVHPTFEARHGTPYLLRCDKNDSLRLTERAYEREVADQREHQIEVLIVFAKESMANDNVFVWTDVDRHYWTRVLNNLAACGMPFAVAVPARWNDPRWMHTALNTEGYVRAVIECAERIDTVIRNVDKIVLEYGLEKYRYTDEAGLPVYFVPGANGVPFEYPERFWADVKKYRQESHAALWGNPHAWKNGGGLSIFPCDHGFKEKTWYSAFQWTPHDWWTRGHQRINFPDPEIAWRFMEKATLDALKYYGPEHVIVPVSCGWDRYRLCWTTDAEWIPPVYERRQAFFCDRWTRFFEKNEVQQFVVIRNEPWEGEATCHQEEHDYRDFIAGLRMRTVKAAPEGKA